MKKHVIDFLFPILLFLTFAASSLVLILLAANIYQKTTKMADANYENRTALTYISEKIHQNDAYGQISIETFHGKDSLRICQTFNQTAYQTYIYEEDGMLKELFLKEGVDSQDADGRSVMQIKNLQMRKIKPGLFSFSCSTGDGDTIQTTCSVLTKEGNP